MIYAIVTSAVFLVIIALVVMHFQRLRDADAVAQKERSRTSRNRLKLLEILSQDMAQVTSKLCLSTNALNSDIEAMRRCLQAVVEKPESAKDLGAVMAPQPKHAQIESVLGTANRVFDDMRVLLAIWNGEFERTEEKFEINTMVFEIIEGFQGFIQSQKQGVTVEFNPQEAIYCAADHEHISRCIRAMLAQALKQTDAGAINIKVMVAEGVLRTKAEIVVLIADGSRRSGKGAAYDIAPDRVQRNEFLKDDPSAALRLNLAQQTAAQLGGKLSFHPKKEGNMIFRLAFQAQLFTEEV